MLLNKKTIINISLIAVLAIAAGAGYYFSRLKSPTKAPEEKTYAKLVTPKDQEPIKIAPKVFQNGRAIALPILMYHHVGQLPNNPDSTRVDLTVPTDNFEAQVKWLKDNSYNSLSLKDIYLAAQKQFVLPKNPVVFTFDDGYKDAFDNAVPILKKYGFTGSFAIITGWPGQTFGNNVYASWSDIYQAYTAGNEIVSHTQTHFDGSNPKFNSDYIYRELNGSILDIKNNLGFTTNVLIYPYGHYTQTYIEQAKKAGFVMGITVHEGKIINLDNLMEVPRVRVHGQETTEKFIKILTE